MNGYFSILQLFYLVLVLNGDDAAKWEQRMRFWSKWMSGLALGTLEKDGPPRAPTTTLDAITQCYQVEGCGPPNSWRQVHDSQYHFGPVLQERCAYLNPRMAGSSRLRGHLRMPQLCVCTACAAPTACTKNIQT